MITDRRLGNQDNQPNWDLMRTSFLFIVLTAYCLNAHAGTRDDSGSGDRPNVVMIYIDDMGYGDIGAFGNTQVPTPNMDRLAKEGMKLTNYYSNSPICSASRVALVTGQYQQRYRIHSYFNYRKRNRERKMPDYLPVSAFTYAKLLSHNGYATAHFGKWHMGGGRDVDDAPLPKAYGYDESLVSHEGLGDRILWSKTGNQRLSWQFGRGEIYHLPKYKTTETYVDRAIDFIKRHQNQPFLVNVFPNDVHDKHLPSQTQLAKWKDTSSNPYDNSFFAVLAEMDRQLGRLLDSLDELGLAENTIVILTSDNGPTDWPYYYEEGYTPPGYSGPFFGRKWSLYEGGIHMPFLIRWPVRITAGSTNESTLMAAIDLMPTLANLTKSKIPADVKIDGEDLSNAFVGEPIQRSGPIFWEYGIYEGLRPGKKEHASAELAMRDGDWKLLMRPDGSDTKLFNLAEDPGETSNLSARNPETVQRMKNMLDAWWREMNVYYEGN